jgi:hypothetical protein
MGMPLVARSMRLGKDFPQLTVAAAPGQPSSCSGMAPSDIDVPTGACSEVNVDYMFKVREWRKNPSACVRAIVSARNVCRGEMCGHCCISNEYERGLALVSS